MGTLGTVLKTLYSYSFSERAIMNRTIRWVVFFAAVAAAGYFVWQRYYGPEAIAKAENAAKAAARRPPIPVSVASVEKTDFPVYLTGLGTVQGFNTVQV